MFELELFLSAFAVLFVIIDPPGCDYRPARMRADFRNTNPWHIASAPKSHGCEIGLHRRDYPFWICLCR